jgi:hypothetical protein
VRHPRRLARARPHGRDLSVQRGRLLQRGIRDPITVNGTPASPITIRAADGESPIVTRPQPADFSCDQNNIEIVNSSYRVNRGLHFKGGDGDVSFIGGHHITFEDNEVYETEGEGMYVGCNNVTCIASNHLIEGNYIHHTRRPGRRQRRDRDQGWLLQQRRAEQRDPRYGQRHAIPVHLRLRRGAGLNVVEGNAMWNCGEAIQVISDAVVRNNLILSTITAAPHAQVAQMRNLRS